MMQGFEYIVVKSLQVFFIFSEKKHFQACKLRIT